MKDNSAKKLVSGIYMFATLPLAYFATWGGNYPWVENVFIFLTWFTFITVLFVGVPSIKESVLKTYREGLHFPLWLDAVYYTTIVLVVVSYGWMFTGFQWLIKALIDVSLRREAENLNEINTK